MLIYYAECGDRHLHCGNIPSGMGCIGKINSASGLIE